MLRGGDVDRGTTHSARVLWLAAVSAAAALGLWLTRASAMSAAPSPAPRPADSLIIMSTEPTRVVMRNVDFRLAEGLLLRIAALDGEMRGVARGVVDFDDKHSYVLTIDSGQVALTTGDVTNLLNRYVFAYPGAPLKHLRASQRGDQLGLTGTLRKGVDIPFDLTSNIAMTPDNKMRLHPTRIRIFGVDGKKLMSALGLNLQTMVDVSKAKGVTVDGNDLILDPLIVLPPPVIRGRIVAVRVDHDRLVQFFGHSIGAAAFAAVSLPDSTAINYMRYRGGTLHFGKLYMTNADMLVVDDNPSDPFDFDNDHYQRQLIAGRSRTLPSLGLEVWMPDAAKLSAARVSASTR